MQQVSLNMVPSGVPPAIYTSQYDVGRKFQLFLYDGKDRYTMPNGYNVVLKGIKPDNHSFAYSNETDSNVVLKDSAVTVSTTEQMCSIAGRTECELTVYDASGNTIGSLNFFIIVEKIPIPDDAVASDSDISAYQKMSDQVVSAHEDFKATRDYVDSVKNDTDAIRLNVKSMQTDVHAYVDAFKESVNHIVSVTLEASKWSGTSAPYKYDLSSITDFSGLIAHVGMDPTVYTQAQFQAALDADIRGAMSDSYLYAMGDKPTIDIPIMIGWMEYKRKE